MKKIQAKPGMIQYTNLEDGSLEIIVAAEARKISLTMHGSIVGPESESPINLFDDGKDPVSGWFASTIGQPEVTFYSECTPGLADRQVQSGEEMHPATGKWKKRKALLVVWEKVEKGEGREEVKKLCLHCRYAQDCNGCTCEET